MKLSSLLITVCTTVFFLVKYEATASTEVVLTSNGAAADSSVIGNIGRKRCLKCKKGKRTSETATSKVEVQEIISTVQINLRGPPVPYAIDFNYFSNYKLVCSKLRANSNHVNDAPCYSSQQYLNQLDGFILAVTFILAIIFTAISGNASDASMKVVSVKRSKKAMGKRKIIPLTADQRGFMIAVEELDMGSLACPSE